MANPVRRHIVRVAEREDDAAQEASNELVREVCYDAVEGHLRLVHGVPDRPVHERRIVLLAPLGFVAFECRGAQVHH